MGSLSPLANSVVQTVKDIGEQPAQQEVLNGEDFFDWDSETGQHVAAVQFLVGS